MIVRTTMVLAVCSLGFAQQPDQDRKEAYWRALASPMGGVSALVSSGIRQATDSPKEWNGAEGFGYRMADAYGRRFVRATLEYEMSRALHENNKFEPSGMQGFWPRTMSAVKGTFLARHDDGSMGLSISRLSGTAGASIVARSWLPPSKRDWGNTASGFGIAMGIETGIHVFREFWPDIRKKFGR